MKNDCYLFKPRSARQTLSYPELPQVSPTENGGQNNRKDDKPSVAC